MVKDAAEISEARPKTPAPQRRDIILAPPGDNRPRWRPGERFHHLFEATCRELAEKGEAGRLAVDGDDAKLSFADLDARANQLARRLLREGYGSGDVIGLLFNRSVESYVAVLAILKIHAAFVPLDIGFPQRRMRYICDDAGVRAILTMAERHKMAAELGRPALAVDALRRELDAESADALAPGETPPPTSELAYIVYTSGSTGRPKGVPIEHGAICNFLRVACERYGYAATDRMYQGLSMAFDFSVEEIWAPLLAGATLVPNQTGANLVGSDLAAFLNERRITALCCVPTLLATVEDDVRDLRLLIVSGEACPRDLVRRWARSGRRLLNAYGPTEATVSATVAELTADAAITIGEPLPTYTIVILAPGEAAALPRGEVGEIAIAGVGLSPGYIGRDEETRRAFVPDFVGAPNNPSGRLYRTGDLGRVNSAGQLEYFGRIDQQVKIAGYRIELSEIESVIMETPSIAQAVVASVQTDPGRVDLAAYFTLAEGAAPISADSLASALRERLPRYMIPTSFQQLDAIPLLTSGKADRKSLPPPPRAAPSPSVRGAGADEAIRTPTEQAIEALWDKRIRASAIARTDSFFDIGGDSLSSAQVAIDIAKTFDVELAPMDLVRRPRLDAISAHVDALLAEKDGASHAAAPRDAAAQRQVTALLASATGGEKKKPNTKLKEPFWGGAKNRFLQILALYAPGMTSLRVWLHRKRGVKMGTNVSISTSALIETSYPHLVEMGDNVHIGIRAVIIAHFDDMTNTDPGARPTVRIEDYAYIGPAAVILPNVTIGEGAVVTAGSVVSTSVPPRTVVQGNPAKPVAHCGAPLAWTNYTKFMEHLRPFDVG